MAALPKSSKPAANAAERARIAQRGSALCVCNALKSAARKVTRFYDAELAKAGVTFSQFALLVRVAACEQGSMADVAGAVGLDPSTLSRTLKPLEAAGWIVIAPDPENRRIRRVRVSEAGAAKMDEAGIQWMAAQKAAQAVFPKQMLAAIAEGAASLSVD